MTFREWKGRKNDREGERRRVEEREREREREKKSICRANWPGHRCQTPQTTSLYPALNPNQLASVSFNIFARAYVPTCTSHAFDVLLRGCFLKPSSIEDARTCSLDVLDVYSLFRRCRRILTFGRNIEGVG